MKYDLIIIGSGSVGADGGHQNDLPQVATPATMKGTHMEHSTAPQSNRNWLIIGILAFLTQGGWTLWVNFSHGWVRAVPSAVMQGLLSGISASAMTLIMEQRGVEVRRTRLLQEVRKMRFDLKRRMLAGIQGGCRHCRHYVKARST